jgi:hypothetical protein
MSVSEEAQKIAHALAVAFRVGSAANTQPDMHRYGDKTDRSTVDLLSCADSPMDGITAYGTVRLSDHGLGVANDLRAEIIGAFPTVVPAYANVLTTCAFNVINDGAPLFPGVIHREAVGMYNLSPTLRHILFVTPFLWGEQQPPTLKLADRTVAWLMAVPITEAEREYAETYGSQALENLFEQEDIDVFDVARPSVA